MLIPHNISYSINDSLLYNCILGFILFILNIFIIITYKINISKQIQILYFSENSFYHSFFQAISSILYSLIYIILMIPKGSQVLFSIQNSGSFFYFTFVISSIIAFSKKKIFINTHFFNKIMLTIIFIINISRFSMINTFSAIISILLFILGSKLYFSFFKQINQINFTGEFFSPSQNSNLLSKIFKTLLLPFEFILDYSIIPFNATNKSFLLSYRKRAFIAPLLNTTFLLIYIRFNVSLFLLCALLFFTIFSSFFLSIYVKNTKFENFILFYSFTITFIYLFCIAKEQINTAINISKILNINQNKIFVWYLPPLYSLSGIISAIKSYKNGLRKLSLISIFLEYFINILFNFFLSLKTTLFDFKSLLKDNIILLSYLMHNSVIFIWMSHTNFMKGRICKEISLMFFFLVVTHYCFLYHLF